jgi:MFS family permease
MDDAGETAHMTEPTHPAQRFRGNTMLAVAAVAMFLAGPAQTYGFSAFIDPLIDEFGWSRSRISASYSIATLLCAIPTVFVGRLIDRAGSRKMMAISALLYGIALIWLSQVNTMAALIGGFTLVRATGFAALTLSARTLIPQWFIRRRGWAFSLIGVSTSLSFALLPRFNQLLIEWVGWRNAWLILGIVMAAGLMPLAAALVRDRPEAVGQLPDGRVSAAEAGPALLADAREDWTLKQAARTRVFWILLLAGTVPSVTGTGMSFHFMSIMSEGGLSLSFAASLFAIESLVALPMTFLAGWIVDRRPARHVQTVAQIAAAIAFVVLIMAAGPVAAICFAALRGVASGLWNVAADVVWPTYFGRRYIGSIRSITMVGTVVGAAFGPIPLGLVYDSTGSYTPGLIAFAILPALAAIAMRWATPPARLAHSV